MTNIYEIENRVLVPNWRDFKRTVKIGELGDLNNNSKAINIDNSFIKNDWENKKSIGVAADLINSLFISNDLHSKELQEAMDFIEANRKDSSSSLISLIKKIRSEINPTYDNSNTILEKNIDSINEFNSLFNSNLLNKIISKTKNVTKNYPHNSINWIELARLYTIKNQLIQANQCIMIALNLAPNNRFVLRSAVRFFIHTYQEDKAIFYLKKSDSIKSDPWLISAHIASSKLIGRYSPFIKQGVNLISSKNYSAFDLTELASSLGTLELENGKFKQSKSFLDLSIQNPNDNSLAQFEWLSKKEDRLVFNSHKFKDVKNPFEAFAYENFQNGNYKEAFYNCINWYLDFPFSSRPLMFGTYITLLLQDFDSAIILAKIGLKLNQNEVGFINNIIYSLCMKNELQEIPQYFDLITKNVLDDATDSEKITIQATLGLYYLRIGQIEEGKMFYGKAIESFKLFKNNYYYYLAIINYTRELYLIKDDDFKTYWTLFNTIQSNDKDIMLQKGHVEEIVKT